MASESKVSAAKLATLLAKVKAKGVDVDKVLGEQSKAPTTSSKSVRSLSAVVSIVEEATSQRKSKRKSAAAEGSGKKRRRSATPQGPIWKSGRTKKAPVPVVEEKAASEEGDEEVQDKRSVVAEVVIDRGFMASHQLVEVNNLLIAQGWDHLFRKEVLVDEDVVREFYSEFKLEERSRLLLATFVIKGEVQVITPRDLGKLLNVPVTGYAEYIKGIWPASVAKAEVISRVGEDPNNVSNQGSALSMGIINRILHKLVCTTLMPRSQKHGVINFWDFLLVDKLRAREPICLPKLLLQHMKYCAASENRGLPYPGLVKHILCDLGIYEDPGSFSISCFINDIKIERAMCDLGASISLMPYSLCKKLNMGEPKPTSMILRLADRSSRFPKGVLKDVPVRVGNFYIPGDFVVLEMEEDKEIPILLRRPFLYTAGAIFDTTKGSITMRVGDEEVEFNLEKAQKGPSSTMTCNYLDLVDTYELYDVPNLLMSAIDLDNELPDIADCWAILEEECEEGSLSDKGKESCSVELKALPTSLRYEFLGPNSSLPIIVNASLNDIETSKFLDVVREHKGAIGYSIDDLKGSPNLCMHEINVESDSMPSRERARRLNPIVGEVVKKEVLKLLDAGIIFPVADSKWVSPIHVVPKKGGMTVIKNEKNELIPTRTVTGWRMCVDYRKLNQATRKDHFPLPFIDQMLERLAKHDYFCYLDGYSGFFQIPIHPQDQEKTTFTCPYGTFAYRRMPFGLCNAPGTFQRCMMEGIVLGHLVSKRGIEVDKAKIEVMEKLPPPRDVKGIRSFLGHAGFYRRFIKDFSKIAKPLTNLLCNDTKFHFDEDCLVAFKKLKEALISAPIIPRQRRHFDRL
ncbi:unnamed protein product [Rhodiola kirilowii]